MEFRSLANRALIRIGAIAANEVMEDSDAQLCLSAMNLLLDQWQSESLLLFAQQRVLWDIVPGTGTYLVGTGQDVDTNRPVHIDGVSYVDTTQSPPLELPLTWLTDQAYDSISLKDLTSNLPTQYWYNLTYPYATIKLYPVPTQADLDGVLYCRTQVAQIADIDEDVLLPQGWLRMMVTNLSVEVAPMFTRNVSQELAQQARDSKSAVKRSNIQPVELQIAPGALIQTGGGPYWTHGDFLSGGQG